MKLRTRLLLAQLPLALALALVGILAVVTLSQLGQHAQVTLKGNYRSVLAAQRMKEAVERMDSATLFVLAGQKELGVKQLEIHVPRFEAELRVEEGNITEPGEIEAVRRLRAAWGLYTEALADFQKLSDGPSTQAAYFARLEPLFFQVKREADTILNLNQDAMLRKSERVRRQGKRVSVLMIFASLGAFLAGVLASSALTSRMLRPLNVLTLASHRIGTGDLDARAVVSGHDELAGLAGAFNDMADGLAQYRRSSLGMLLQAQLAAQSAIDSIPDPVVIFGHEGKVLNVNRAAEELLGLRFEADSRDPMSRLSREVREVLERVKAHVLGGHGPYVPKGFEEAVRAASGEGECYLLPRAEPVRDERETVMGVTVIMQDVTRLRRFDELKNDLVATVAHELRTPLTSLRMAIHLCVEEAVGPLTEGQAELLQTAREDCDRLQTVVDDLLDLGRIQSGRVKMQPEPLEVEALLTDALETHRGAAREKGVELRAEVFPASWQVLADPERIRLVFSNLLSNAVRHTPGGGHILLRARCLESRVRFEVADSGEGIAPEHQRLVFDKFYRVPGARAGGAGLGLSIAQEILAAHGGELGVESEPGQGSTFWFTLPQVGSMSRDTRPV